MMKESTLEAIGYICQDIVSWICCNFFLIAILYHLFSNESELFFLPAVTLETFLFLQEPEILQPQSNEILTAIVHGMKKEEPR